MKKKFSYLGFVILIMGAGLIALGGNLMKTGKIKIFYLPFDIGTYLPVTPDNIEEQAKCVFILPSSDEVVLRLKNIIESPHQKGDFIYKLVRLKIDGLYKDPILVDMEGNCIESKEQVFKLSEKDFSDLKNLTTKLEKQRPYDCRYK